MKDTKDKREVNKTTALLWFLFILVLIAMLPHTAWFFSRNEDGGAWALVKGWTRAVSLEIAVGAFAHKLSQYIPQVKGKNKLRRQWFNWFSFGLTFSLLGSLIANVSHGVQFSDPTKLFTLIFSEVNTAKQFVTAGLVQGIISGSLLPVASLVFTFALSNLSESEAEVNPEVATLKSSLQDARKSNTGLRKQLESMNDSLEPAQEYADLFNESYTVADRIKSAHALFPEWSQKRIAAIVEKTPGYVSQILSDKTQVNTTPAKGEE